MENDTLSMAEVARYCHAHGGGAIACLDADKAYDRVEVDFLVQILHAMGFPESFLAVIRVMYKDMWARLKVNGHVGGAFRQRNGLRQGLPSSCPLWLIYIEPLVRRLRDDPRINGISIPGALGRGGARGGRRRGV